MGASSPSGVSAPETIRVHLCMGSPETMAKQEPRIVPAELNPLWYKSAIIYEVPVRAFFDSNADGIGDLRGLTQKLDYIQELGVTALWLLPFYPSPLKD